jgi:hypothetical protein
MERHEIDNSDGLMLRFDTAHEALGFAVDYHRLLAEGLPLPLKARAGLHVGRLDLRANAPTTSPSAHGRSRCWGLPR